ncbi:hypothetical protein V2K56_20845 [Pseudomonas alliivorans]|nr:hypothetical protein [Pseudomonas alliivorans]MEE4803139.1 hypothetical protein [Pseudomonas alliivorans]
MRFKAFPDPIWRSEKVMQLERLTDPQQWPDVSIVPMLRVGMPERPLPPRLSS